MLNNTLPVRAALLLKGALPGLVVFISAVILYWPSLDHPFNFDDEIFLDDANVQLGRWKELLFPPVPRFLTWLVFLGQHQIFGPHPGGFHALSVFLHALNSAIVFWILGSIMGLNASKEGPRDGKGRLPAGLFPGVGAMVFALHPVQSESVLNIYQQSTLLGALFSLLALSLWMGKGTEKGWSTRESLSLVCFLLAIAARETVAVLPLVFWVFDGLLKNRWRPTLRLLPFIGLSSLAVLGYLARTTSDALQLLTTRAEDALLYAAVQVKVIWLYIFLIVGVRPLNIDHHVLPLLSWADLGWWLSLAGWVLVGWGLVRLRRRSVRSTFFILFFFLFLIPTSSLLPRPDHAFDHRIYIGFLGISGLAGIMVHRLSRGWLGGTSDCLRGALSDRRWAKTLTLAALAALLTLITWGSVRRIEVWSDPVTLWLDAVSKSPAKYRPNYNLGVLLMNSSPARAEFYLNRAIEIDPTIPLAFRSLGEIHFEQGRFKAAESLWRQAVMLEPEDLGTHLALGRLYAEQNDFFNARQYLMIAVQLHPDQWQGHAELARLHLQFGLDGQAVEHAEKALALNPSSPELHFLLGDAVSSRSNWERAAELYEAGLKSPLDNPSPFFKLGTIYWEMGLMDKARQSVQAGLSQSTSASQRQLGEYLLRQFDLAKR